MLSRSASPAETAHFARRRGRWPSLAGLLCTLLIGFSSTTALAEDAASTEPTVAEASAPADDAAVDAATPPADEAPPASDAEPDEVSEPAAEASEPTAEASEAAPVTETVEETVVEVTEQEPAPVSLDDDEPTVLERQIVAFVASGVAVTSLAVGVVVGFLAWQQFNCLQNVLSCNETLQEPIHGADYFTARSNVEHLALIADMAYLFAGAATIVAITGFIRGFFFVDDGADAEESATSGKTPARRDDALAALDGGVE